MVQGQDRCKRSYPEQSCAMRKFQVIEGPNVLHQIAFYAFHSFLKEVQTNAGCIRMWLAFVISTADSFGRPQNNKKQQQKVVNCNILYSMWSLVLASPRCPWSATFPKMIKYFVEKKNMLNNESYRDLLISILLYDEVSAFLLWVKARN